MTALPRPLLADPGPNAASEEHTWQLRDVEFEDGVTTRRFECVACGAAHFE